MADEEGPVKEAEREVKREVKKVRREFDVFEKEAESFLEKKITIQVKHLLVIILFVILVGGAFFIGRYGFPALTLTKDEGQKLTEPAVQPAVNTSAAAAQNVQGQESEAEAEHEQELEQNPQQNGNVSNTTENKTTKTTILPSVKAELLESYDAVTLEVADVVYDWKETWGKITDVKIKIINKEKVAVGPYTLIMTVEGYEDVPEVIEIPEPMKVVPSGYSATRSITIPYGFSYNPLTMGQDADNVELSFVLKDEEGVAMATLSRAFDLT